MWALPRCGKTSHLSDPGCRARWVYFSRRSPTTRVGDRSKERKHIMLIINDEQRLRAGIGSLSKRSPCCCKALAAYPLILSDEPGRAGYHAACAAQLPTAILLSLYTLSLPPA